MKRRRHMKVDDVLEITEHGIGLGFAAAAGLAAESGLSGVQLATLLERFSMQPGACRALAQVALEHAGMEGELKPHHFRDALASLMAATRNKA